MMPARGLLSLALTSTPWQIFPHRAAGLPCVRTAPAAFDTRPGTAAGTGEAEGDEQRRNYDYAEILRRGFFPPEDQSAQQVAAAEAQGVSKVSTCVIGLFTSTKPC